MADYSTRRFLRAKLPVQILKGFYPTEPNKLSSLAEPLNATDIKSGMAIVKNGAGKWIPAAAANASTGISIYIALTDADALDVQASGKLVGLDCSDKYEVQTGYFDDEEVWAVGDKLTVGDGGLFVKAATEGDTVVGEITEVGTVDTTNAIPYAGFTPSCAAADATLIQFKTLDQVVPA